MSVSTESQSLVQDGTKNSKMQKHWTEIALEAQTLRDASIPREWLLPVIPSPDVVNVMNVPYTCGLLTQEELQWTDKTAAELLELLHSSALKSYDLTLAFCKRAAIAHQLVNCMTEMWFDEALERAKELDSIFEESGPVGPYHGLPFSIKNTYDVKGRRSSCGYVGWYHKIATEDSMVVKIIRDSGAVLFCKTNNPQTVMHLETVSNCKYFVYGRTLNPINRNLSPGGSSGGESALMALGGSPIGLGADGGGSIRSPAAGTGFFGMKATSERIPIFRGTATMRGCKSFPIVSGPICRTAQDWEYFAKTILATEPWKTASSLVPIPWREPHLSKIVIGVYMDDGVVKPHPPIQHALQELVRKLGDHPDFEVVEWKPFDHGLGYDLLRQLYWEDGGKETRQIMIDSGEPILDLTEWVMKDSHVKPRTLKESWELNFLRDEYQKGYLKHWLSAPKVPDFIVGPVGPSLAPRHDTARYWGYAAIFNLLDYPSCSFPTGIVCSPEQHPIDTHYVPQVNEFDTYNWSQYDPHVSAGAPVNLQLTGRKWECEKVIRCAGLVADLMRSV